MTFGAEIQKEVKALFEANMTITDWDIPEADDAKAARLLIEIIKKEVPKLEEDIANGKYNNY